MALNFSHRPMLPPHLAEDNLVKPMSIANGYIINGIPDKDGFGQSWLSRREPDDGFDHCGDRCDHGGLHDPVPKDIVDLFPVDPFGMDISSTVTAITGWLEGLGVDYAAFGEDVWGGDEENHHLFAELNFIANESTRFHTFPPDKGAFHETLSVGSFGGCLVEKEEFMSCNDDYGSACSVEDILTFWNDDCDTSIQRGEGYYEEILDVGAPHSALSFSLGYLGLRDLLVVERVCKSLCSTVRGDPLFWRSIHVDQPLNEKITDDILLQLTSKAQGNLQCLSMVECQKITDNGLKRVLESNPRLTKLCVPGCTRLSVEGIVNSLRAFKATGAQGVKNLRIGGIYGVTQKHFEELKFLLGYDSTTENTSHKPHFYHRGNLYLSCYDDCAIDIEVCPRCQNLRLVYDCPVEGCVGTDHSTQECRGCSLCISRCGQCGRCINDGEYEETFCLELRCSDCLNQLSKYEVREGGRKVCQSRPSAPVEQNSQLYQFLHEEGN